MLGYLLGFAIPLVYLAAWTAFARVLYQRYRIHEVEKANCPNRAKPPYYSYNHDRDCHDCRKVNKLWWQEGGLSKTAKPYGNDDLLFFAFIQAFPWPLTGPFYLMVRMASANPPLAPSEIKARENAQAQRIKELEDLNRRMSALTSIKDASHD